MKGEKVMNKHFRHTLWLLLSIVLPATPVLADVPWQFADDTRYMALGDSLAAGWGAQPATQGYVYRLYQKGIFAAVPDTLFANAAVPGATSGDVLAHQVPLAVTRFSPDVVTLTVGGNDLLAILAGADPGIVLAQFQGNLFGILATLCGSLPDAEILVSNLYTISGIPGADQVVPIFNQIVAGVAGQFVQQCDVRVADVYTAFLGNDGLLLIQRNGAGQFEVHPTNAGYRVMAEAFENAHFTR
jgi:lysophospholipase L1-like esterase